MDIIKEEADCARSEVGKSTALKVVAAFTAAVLFDQNLLQNDTVIALSLKTLNIALLTGATFKWTKNYFFLDAVHKEIKNIADKITKEGDDKSIERANFKQLFTQARDNITNHAPDSVKLDDVRMTLYVAILSIGTISTAYLGYGLYDKIYGDESKLTSPAFTK